MAAQKESRMEQAHEYVNDALETGKRKSREMAQSVDRCVHHHPWRLIAAMGVSGALVGYLLSRR